MRKEHTQTPWKAVKHYIFSDDGKTLIASIDGESPDKCAANRDLIVRAVNSHEALVSALEKMSGYLNSMPDLYVPDDVKEAARAALALAKEGE